MQSATIGAEGGELLSLQKATGPSMLVREWERVLAPETATHPSITAQEPTAYT